MWNRVIAMYKMFENFPHSLLCCFSSVFCCFIFTVCTNNDCHSGLLQRKTNAKNESLLDSNLVNVGNALYQFAFVVQHIALLFTA